MDFWIFSMDSPGLGSFYAEHKEDSKYYYALYIQKVSEDFPELITKTLHLRDNVVLLLDSPSMIPIYMKLRLDGFVIILTEEFCIMDEQKALLKLCFFHSTPERVMDMGTINEQQQLCIDLIYKEYHSKSDEFQEYMIRNLAVNLILLSSTVHFGVQIKTGHLLGNALHFMNLVNTNYFHERKKSFYAQQLAITEKTLDQSLKIVFNTTFRNVIVISVIIQAIRMLVFSDKNITQIAHELNFDVSDFNKLFIRYKGMSPKELRTSYRKIVEYAENR